MKLFPKHVSTIAAWTETLFSFGYMLGNFAQKFSIQKKLFKNYFNSQCNTSNTTRNDEKRGT